MRGLTRVQQRNVALKTKPIRAHHCHSSPVEQVSDLPSVEQASACHCSFYISAVTGPDVEQAFGLLRTGFSRQLPTFTRSFGSTRAPLRMAQWG